MSETAYENELTRTVFRMSIGELIRRTKRLDMFRHPLFATAELFDPLEPDKPFTKTGILPIIEQEWHFRRDAVPNWITLNVGRAARDRTIAGLKSEYDLPPAERFARVKDGIHGRFYDPRNPDTWDDAYSCLLLIPPHLSGEFIPLYWYGGRSEALTHPQLRQWFFDPRVKVLHDAEATREARCRVAMIQGFGK